MQLTLTPDQIGALFCAVTSAKCRYDELAREARDYPGRDDLVAYWESEAAKAEALKQLLI